MFRGVGVVSVYPAQMREHRDRKGKAFAIAPRRDPSPGVGGQVETDLPPTPTLSKRTYFLYEVRGYESRVSSLKVREGPRGEGWIQVPPDPHANCSAGVCLRYHGLLFTAKQTNAAEGPNWATPAHSSRR
ncbi:hypothetical protein SAMN06265222_1246 [Neorhodopirellula lusitana]|uniref:Uncharacterized protein n=1 Tax=Neorhodopirellula lusitana TaxID=445327 RepID=A0ABY1QQZ0_9BACT|nr:hypothetical protein SAMN06265222_1246 [Neorhodopirellula lusitana]